MKIFFVLTGLLIVPLSAVAQGAGFGVEGIIADFGNIINAAIPVVLALAVLYFFWGLAQYVLNSANEDKKEEGRNIMIWGIIALFVMVSVWGLIRMLQTTFGVGGQTPIIPEVIL